MPSIANLYIYFTKHNLAFFLSDLSATHDFHVSTIRSPYISTTAFIELFTFVLKKTLQIHTKYKVRANKNQFGVINERE